MLPLPVEVARHLVHLPTSDLNTGRHNDRHSVAGERTRNNPSWSNTGIIHSTITTQRHPCQLTGLIQGSCISPLIANLLLGDLPSAIPQDAALVAFADDIVLLSRTREGIEDAALSLSRALSEHDSGRMTLRRCNQGDFRTDDVEVLGYKLSTRDGEPRAEIPLWKLNEWQEAVRDASHNDAAKEDAALTQVHRVLDDRLRQYPHASVADKETFRADCLAFVRANLEDEKFMHASGDFRRDRHSGTYNRRRGPENQPPPGSARWAKESWGERL